MARLAVSVCLCLLWSLGAAWVPSHSTDRSTRLNAELRPGSLEAATAELGRVPYGEASRKYRRTVYSHKDWVRHRSNNRLVENVRGMFISGVIRQLQREIALIASVATFCVVWNDLLVPSNDMLPHLCLPMLPFTLSSPALGLLLVFRTNASYQRWLEARMRWGVIVAQSRNAVRMASTFADLREDGREALDELATAVWATARSIMNKLAGPEDELEYQRELQDAYPSQPGLVQRLVDSPDRSASALMQASLVLDRIPVDEKRRVETDKSLAIMGDTISACDKIFTSPVPLVYTRHTARFLTIWMLLLPFAIHDEFIKADASGLPTIPASAVLALFLFGIEELAIQLEEPFSILPMQKLCDEIRSVTKGLIDWSEASQVEDAKVKALK